MMSNTCQNCSNLAFVYWPNSCSTFKYYSFSCVQSWLSHWTQRKLSTAPTKNAYGPNYFHGLESYAPHPKPLWLQIVHNHSSSSCHQWCPFSPLLLTLATEPGYKLIFSKSECYPANNLVVQIHYFALPFQMSRDGFKYLGIRKETGRELHRFQQQDGRTREDSGEISEHVFVCLTVYLGENRIPTEEVWKLFSSLWESQIRSEEMY